MPIISRLTRALRAIADRLVPWTVDIPGHLTKLAEPAAAPARFAPPST